MEKTINQQLNDLFERWKAKSLENGEQTNDFGVIFTSDGLVYKNDTSIDVEKEWAKSHQRVLFILKDQPTKYSDDVRFWLRNVEGKDNTTRQANRELVSRFIHNIANIFYGLQNASTQNPLPLEQVSFDAVKECFNTIPFAFIESKKQGGGTSITNKVLIEYLDKYSTFIKKEIEILKPNMIVCTSGVIYKRILDLFSPNEILEIEGHNSIKIVNREKPILIFCSFHPSARKSYETIYEGVMDHYRAFLKHYPQIKLRQSLPLSSCERTMY